MSLPEDPEADFFTPDDFPPVDVDADQEVFAALERLKTATYTGRDPEHLVTVVVDGEAMVTRIRFAGTAVTRSREVVERAIAVAIDAAGRQVDAAMGAVVGKSFPHLATPQTAHASYGAVESYGGVEAAYDPAAHNGDGVDA
jgi:DNA-binding protein YbaB